MLRLTTQVAIFAALLAVPAGASVSNSPRNKAAGKTSVKYLTPGCKGSSAHQVDQVRVCATQDFGVRIGGLPALTLSGLPLDVSTLGDGPYMTMPGTTVLNNLEVLGNFTANITFPAPAASVPDGTYQSDYLYWNATTAAWTVGSAKVNIGQNATATGNKSPVAIGAGTVSTADSTVAIGFKASSVKTGGIAIGSTATISTTAMHGVSIGTNSQSTGYASVAIGYYGWALAGTGTAVGAYASVYSDDGTALGSSANTNAVGGTAVGVGATVRTGADYGVAVGQGTDTYGTYSVTVGSKAKVLDSNGIAIGGNAQVQVQESIVIGAGAMASNVGCIAVGKDATCAGTTGSSIAIGKGTATDGAIVLGISGIQRATAGAFFVDAVRDVAISGSKKLFYDPATNEIHYDSTAARRLEEEPDSGETQARIAALEAEVADLKRLLKEHLAL